MPLNDLDAFFTAGVPADLDLMAFPCTEGHEQVFCGAVAKIVEYTRRQLDGHSDQDVRFFVSIGESVLAAMVDGKHFKRADGRPYSMVEIRARPAMQFLQSTCVSLPEAYARANSGDTDLNETMVPTPVAVCLAIALAHAVTALSRIDTPGLFQSGGWHAMAAAEAMSVYYLQANDENYRSDLRTQAAKRSAKIGWEPLESVKQLAFQRWNESPHLSRAAAIRLMLPEILDAADKAGKRLTGGNPERTIAGWFRDPKSGSARRNRI